MIEWMEFSYDILSLRGSPSGIITSARLSFWYNYRAILWHGLRVGLHHVILILNWTEN